jgi:hypothetical protein
MFEITGLLKPDQYQDYDHGFIVNAVPLGDRGRHIFWQATRLADFAIRSANSVDQLPSTHFVDSVQWTTNNAESQIDPRFAGEDEIAGPLLELSAIHGIEVPNVAVVHALDPDLFPQDSTDLMLDDHGNLYGDCYTALQAIPLSSIDRHSSAAINRMLGVWGLSLPARISN